MINDDKRVLEHFNNIISKRKENEKVEVSRQNIKYLVNKLEKYFTQTEQLQELTDEIYQHLEDKESLEQQNKRYRDYLELIRKTGTYGTSVNNGEVVRSDEANLADEALEGEE